MFINFGLFPGPMPLLKALCLLNLRKLWRKKIIKQEQCIDWCKNELKFWCPRFIQGPTFIPCPKSIPDSKVVYFKLTNKGADHN